ncbi:cell division protein FtsA [Halanaerobium saccharolyticum]|uniref:Cell division protein FtsA n=1 Tax=Halanaerobium saccharolyticum TaxID=43595 RepID=A0A4R7YLX1_9FIRM|nr:cell division FtsA domain-containing protein [Halanaerobium saccharolyticum]RAK08506.1 cell division protein FtsA [Halanaerobium saccharolyticum]TDV97918.1 cell division protein FtsA [Halanaerobium saccharolyticum]TDX59998.1 cell division protein FtsA [Halanaerobium saccharolyticum]
MTEEITFALDIGTRTIVGILIKEKEGGYQIIHSAVREHQTRAMLDGQIHNVARVAEAVAEVKRELEEKSGLTLKNVAIAAAGRALKTVTQRHNIELERSRYVEEDDLKTLELKTIQKAQGQLNNKQQGNSADFKGLELKKKPKNTVDYHFVGYTVRKYKLDGMELGHLLGQRGKNMEVELVATFLPRIVIDSLLSVINRVGLEVEHLTLEPIAASHVVIPEAMSNFNLALVDIGAGTSDIAITKSGSISGYAMVPIAGDEITEIISEKFLIDYNNAERVKCSLSENNVLEVKTILGESIEINKDEVLAAIEDQLELLSSSIAESILEINSNPPQAVIFIGGGSLTPGLKKKFSEKIDIIESRIGIRKREDLENIEGEVEGINTTQTLTPLGIAVTTRETQSKAVFIEVGVNGDRINLLTLSQPTAADALLAADIEMEQLTPRPGMGITATVNGELKTVKGEMGSSAKILLNQEEAKLKEKVNNGDNITFKPGRPGRNAEAEIKDIIPEEDLSAYQIYLNGSENRVGTRVFQNGKLVNLEADLVDGAEIKYTVPRTIRDAMAQIMEVPAERFKNESIKYTFNGREEETVCSNYLITAAADRQKVDLDQPLEDGLELQIEEKQENNLTIRDLLQKKGNQEIDFYFNGSELTVPDQIWEVEVNGEQEELDYTIEAGDQIQAFSRTLTVSGVFDYINYGISDNMQQKMQLILNGEPVNLSAKINKGDKLKVRLNA